MWGPALRVKSHQLARIHTSTYKVTDKEIHCLFPKPVCYLYQLFKETLATIDDSKGTAYSLKWVRVKRGFVKEEALRLLRTNAVREAFELKKREFVTRPIVWGYPLDLVEKILAEVQFSSRNRALKKRTENILKDFAVLHDFQPC